MSHEMLTPSWVIHRKAKDGVGSRDGGRAPFPVPPGMTHRIRVARRQKALAAKWTSKKSKTTGNPTIPAPSRN